MGGSISRACLADSRSGTETRNQLLMVESEEPVIIVPLRTCALDFGRQPVLAVFDERGEGGCGAKAIEAMPRV